MFHFRPGKDDSVLGSISGEEIRDNGEYFDKNLTWPREQLLNSVNF